MRRCGKKAPPQKHGREKLGLFNTLPERRQQWWTMKYPVCKGRTERREHAEQGKRLTAARRTAVFTSPSLAAASLSARWAHATASVIGVSGIAAIGVLASATPVGINCVTLLSTIRDTSSALFHVPSASVVGAPKRLAAPVQLANCDVHLLLAGQTGEDLEIC